MFPRWETKINTRNYNSNGQSSERFSSANASAYGLLAGLGRKISSHHIEKADAGLDRPLYLRNKCSDKNFKITQITNLLYCDYQCHGDLPCSYRVPLD